MRQALARRPALDLEDRLQALAAALGVAEARLDPESVALGRAVVERAGQRLRLGPELTVVALAGATGSGKSSLFNALAGVELSKVGVRRPTTGEAHACVWGAEPPGALLDWLAVPYRFHQGSTVTAARDLDGLVLLDLPDHDSTEMSHRLEVDRLVELVDLMVWVLDPQKYADAAVHERYIRPLAGHQGVMLFVLNQVDRLDVRARRACLADLRRLLTEDGLAGAAVLATSTRTGEGIGELRDRLSEVVAERRAAAERMAADVDRAAERLFASCDQRRKPGRVSRSEREALIGDLADAAGVDFVADAVRRSHLHRSKLATGWALTRWLRRLRPDPLARLHLSKPGAITGRTSLPPPTPIQQARVARGLRRVAEAAGGDLPDPWPRLVRGAATAEEAGMPDLLDRAVGGAELEAGRRPRWWAVAGSLQILLALTAAVGALWLLVLFGLDWLRLPDPPTLRVRRIPLPTLLFLGGLLGGFLAGVLSYQFARIGAGRRQRTARRRLLGRIEELADERVLRPVEEEIGAYVRLCDSLRRARR